MINHDHTQGSLLTLFTIMFIFHIEDNAHTKFGREDLSFVYLL